MQISGANIFLETKGRLQQWQFREATATADRHCYSLLSCFLASTHIIRRGDIENGEVELRKILTTANHAQSGNCDFASVTSISCLATSRSVTEMACCEFGRAQAKSDKISIRAYVPWQNNTSAQKNDVSGKACVSRNRALNATEARQRFLLFLAYSEVILVFPFICPASTECTLFYVRGTLQKRSDEIVWQRSQSSKLLCFQVSAMTVRLH